MLHTRFVLTFVLACSLFPAVSGAHVSRAAERLQHPLIIGASVSSGFLTKGPGERAAELFGGTVTNVAHSGACGKQFANVTSASVAPYTSILAIDFLFWDSTKKDVSASIAALHRLEDAAERAHVPLVIGDIPRLLGTQVSQDLLNDEIHATCLARRGCLVLDLDQLHRRAYWVGVPIDGEIDHFSRLTFEGLHLNERGATYVAQMIVDLLD